jgi:hypothetical protein
VRYVTTLVFPAGDLGDHVTGTDIEGAAGRGRRHRGMTEQQRRLFVPTAIFVARRYHQSARAAAEADPVFRRLWEQGARDELPRAEAWLEQVGPAIAKLIDAPGGRA